MTGSGSQVAFSSCTQFTRRRRSLRRVAVVAAGMTRFGVRQATYRDLIQEAGKAAFDSNKNILPKDIDSFILSSVFPERSVFQSHLACLAAESVGVRPHKFFGRVENMCGSGIVGIRTAYAAIVAGLSDLVMVMGAEKMNIPAPEEAVLNMMTGLDREWEGAYGLTAPPMFALAAQAHALKYGTTEEQLSRVSVKNHGHSKNNPFAQFQKGTSMEQVMCSKMIASPLRLFHCSSMSDGAAAVILASEERAKELTDKPIFIIGTGQAAHGYAVANFYRDMSHWPALKEAANDAYAMAGIGPDDIDFAEVHDCFSIAEIIAYEELGFCEKGEGGRFVEQGLSDYGGKVVVNPRGGLIGCGHPLGATGVAHAGEVFLQMRGEAGPRQVPGAKIALSHTNSGPGEHHILIYQKGF
ncbi:MAG: 3-ketoacyl-CoA thiolase [Chloroflexi bacterium]|nr:3-ketoacyl-CoA thiolase [Chloroflexota bacterium]